MAVVEIGVQPEKVRSGRTPGPGQQLTSQTLRNQTQRSQAQRIGPVRARPRPERHREPSHFASTFAAFVAVDPVAPADFWAEAHAAEQRRDRLVAGWTRSTALLMAAASVLVGVDLLVALIH